MCTMRASITTMILYLYIYIYTCNIIHLLWHDLPFLDYLNKKHKNITFLLKLKKITPFLFLIFIFLEKNTSLKKLFLEKLRSMVYTLILPVSQHLNKNLPQYTSFYIGVSLLFLIFVNFILRLKHSKITLQNAYSMEFVGKCISKFLNIYFLKDLLLLWFQSQNSEQC